MYIFCIDTCMVCWYHGIRRTLKTPLKEYASKICVHICAQLVFSSDLKLLSECLNLKDWPPRTTQETNIDINDFDALPISIPLLSIFTFQSLLFRANDLFNVSNKNILFCSRLIINHRLYFCIINYGNYGALFDTFKYYIVWINSLFGHKHGFIMLGI